VSHHRWTCFFCCVCSGSLYWSFFCSLREHCARDEDCARLSRVLLLVLEEETTQRVGRQRGRWPRCRSPPQTATTHPCMCPVTLHTPQGACVCVRVCVLWLEGGGCHREAGLRGGAWRDAMLLARRPPTHILDYTSHGIPHTTHHTTHTTHHTPHTTHHTPHTTHHTPFDRRHARLDTRHTTHDR